MPLTNHLGHCCRSIITTLNISNPKKIRMHFKSYDRTPTTSPGRGDKDTFKIERTENTHEKKIVKQINHFATIFASFRIRFSAVGLVLMHFRLFSGGSIFFSFYFFIFQFRAALNSHFRLLVWIWHHISFRSFWHMSVCVYVLFMYMYVYRMDCCLFEMVNSVFDPRYFRGFKHKIVVWIFWLSFFCFGYFFPLCSLHFHFACVMPFLPFSSFESEFSSLDFRDNWFFFVVFRKTLVCVLCVCVCLQCLLCEITFRMFFFFHIHHFSPGLWSLVSGLSIVWLCGVLLFFDLIERGRIRKL